jgi:hypothetical protein
MYLNFSPTTPNPLRHLLPSMLPSASVIVFLWLRRTDLVSSFSARLLVALKAVTARPAHGSAILRLTSLSLTLTYCGARIAGASSPRSICTPDIFQ